MYLTQLHNLFTFSARFQLISKTHLKGKLQQNIIVHNEKLFQSFNLNCYKSNGGKKDASGNEGFEFVTFFLITKKLIAKKIYFLQS